MAKTMMWVATGRYGVWVPAPNAPFEGTFKSRSVMTELMNGGAYVRRTIGSYQTWNPVWTASPDEISPIFDLYNGAYGRGPFYFVDPSITRNCLPQHWAAPALSGQDWPTLMYGIKPSYASSIINPGYRCPVNSATYSMPQGAPATLNFLTPRTTLVIPPNHVLNMRAWGNVTGSAVIRVTLYDAITGAATNFDLKPTLIGAGVKIFGAQYSHCDIWLTKTDNIVASLTLTGLIASLTTTDEISTYWSTGEGNSGFQWTGELGRSTYLVKKIMTVNATWVEVGTWLR